MRKTNISLVIIIGITFGCKTKEFENPTLASINVINAVSDIANLKVNPSGKTISYAATTTDQVVNGTGKFYYSSTGAARIVAVNAADTSKILFNGSYQLKSTIYTMYISGNATTVDTMFREEVNFPFIRTDVSIPSALDSVINVRFVNLSTGSPALKVTLSSTPNVDEISGLNYQGISSWKKYLAKLTSPTSYTFQIRRVSDNSLLATRALSVSATTRFKNHAIIVKGTIGGTGINAFAANVVNYY